MYERFADYVPRTDGPAEMTAGPKTVNFDRVEWSVVPDPATKSAAMRAGEFDWWENPTIDLLSTLKGQGGLTTVVKDHSGSIGVMRFNCLYPPFDKPAIRRLVLSAIDQRAFMDAVAGADPELIRTGIGLFVPGTPLASDVGVDMMKGPHDPVKLNTDLAAAGYKGEKVVLLAASDFPVISALALVGGDLLKKIGFNVDYQSLDWGTVVQRRASKEPIDKGGWNMFFTYGGGTGNVSPASLTVIRSNPATAWFGWPNDPKMEALRLAWYDAAGPGGTEEALCGDAGGAVREPVLCAARAVLSADDVPLGPEGHPRGYPAVLSRAPRGLMPHVVVIGAGIVGAATAIELLRDGHRVTILEPGEPGGEQAASYGNGTLLNPSSVIPMSSPGIWRKVPGWLADPLGPLAIRWRYLPRLLPWLTRFLRAGATEARVAATARALRPLLLDAPELHRRLAEEAGVGDLITRQGVLFVFPSRADFEAEALAWRLRRENGVRWLELSADELRQREPALEPALHVRRAGGGERPVP